jgi:hypothetical protein
MTALGCHCEERSDAAISHDLIASAARQSGGLRRRHKGQGQIRAICRKSLHSYLESSKTCSNSGSWLTGTKIA